MGDDIFPDLTFDGAFHGRFSSYLEGVVGSVVFGVEEAMLHAADLRGNMDTTSDTPDFLRAPEPIHYVIQL